MFWLQLTVYLILIAGLLVFIIAFGIPFFRGAPYAPTSPKGVRRMIDLAGIRPGMRTVDLGSGDGRIVIALARTGTQAEGFEINRVLVWWSRMRIRAAGLEDRATVHHRSIFDADLSQYDAILLFGVFHMMEKLEEKLDAEAQPGTVIVSNLFRFPTWQPVHREGKLYVYEKK